MKSKTIVTIGIVTLLGISSLSTIEVPNTSSHNVVYAATATEKTALRKAKSYYKSMNMSKQAIYDQLTSDVEKFSEADAQYAVDKLKVNYKKAALKKAKSYYKTMNMSKQGIYDQLSQKQVKNLLLKKLNMLLITQNQTIRKQL